jgi:hypothetical protein
VGSNPTLSVNYEKIFTIFPSRIRYYCHCQFGGLFDFKNTAQPLADYLLGYRFGRDYRVRHAVFTKT